MTINQLYELLNSYLWLTVTIKFNKLKFNIYSIFYNHQFFFITQLFYKFDLYMVYRLEFLFVEFMCRKYDRTRNDLPIVCIRGIILQNIYCKNNIFCTLFIVDRTRDVYNTKSYYNVIFLESITRKEKYTH